MKINVAQQFKEIDGTPATTGDDKKLPFLLRKVLVEALLLNYNDETPSGEDKVTRYELAVKIQAADGELEVKAEEVALMKKLVGKAYATIIVGQAWKMLEGA